MPPTYAKGMRIPADFELHHLAQRVHAASVMRSLALSFGEAGYGLPPARPLPSPTQPSLDYREPGLIIPGKSILPPVGNQKDCGCCWAWATAKSLSAALAFYWHVSVDISPQYFLDNARAALYNALPLPWDCGGGWFATDLVSRSKNLVPSPGAPAAAAVPYAAAPGREPSGLARPYAAETWDYVAPDGNQGGLPTDAQIKQSLCTRGPLGIAIMADDSWMNYKGGVLCSMPNAPSAGIDHAILRVGWDDDRPWTDPVTGRSGKGAWLDMNQWDLGWGEAGFCWTAYGHYNGGTAACYVIPAVPAGLPPKPVAPPAPAPAPAPVNPPAPAPAGPCVIDPAAKTLTLPRYTPTPRLSNVGVVGWDTFAGKYTIAEGWTTKQAPPATGDPMPTTETASAPLSAAPLSAAAPAAAAAGTLAIITRALAFINGTFDVAELSKVVVAAEIAAPGLQSAVAAIKANEVAIFKGPLARMAADEILSVLVDSAAHARHAPAPPP